MIARNMWMPVGKFAVSYYIRLLRWCTNRMWNCCRRIRNLKDIYLFVDAKVV